MKDIVIIGAGGVGRETSLIIDQINEAKQSWNLIGYIDDNKDNWGKVINNKTILGGIDYLKELSDDIYVVIAIANYEIKKKIVNKLNNKFKFATLIHPKVYTHEFMSIGDGTIIYEGVILKGILEITMGLKSLSMINISDIYKVVISSMFLSFGGLSIHLQVISQIVDIDIKYFNFLIARIYHSIISGLISYILFFFI